VNFFDHCIHRPVLTWMLTLAVILFGVLGYQQLGVDQYPNMEFPVITVMAIMEGASPEVMEEDVTDVLEEYINTISGLRNMNSRTQHGVAQIIIEFDLSKDIEVAAQDVRDKLSLAGHSLPLELEPPVVQKVDMTSFPVVWVPVITERRVVDTSEYVRLQLKPQLETIPGVGAVEMFGRLDRNIRIWLRGDAMRARGLAATDILNALRREHVEVPGGRVISELVEYSVTTDAEFSTLAALERLVIRNVDGAVVRLGDVARIEDSAEDSRVRAYFDGLPTVGAGVLKQPGGNTVAIADELYERLRGLNAHAPSGISFGEEGTLIDFSLSIREAVAETQFALILGALLATFTVFVFLRRVRPTLIVGAAIPLSLIALAVAEARTACVPISTPLSHPAPLKRARIACPPSKLTAP
jgi:HAE1 family hydrophobic/amphiphilic exporter-1